MSKISTMLLFENLVSNHFHIYLLDNKDLVVTISNPTQREEIVRNSIKWVIKIINKIQVHYAQIRKIKTD